MANPDALSVAVTLAPGASQHNGSLLVMILSESSMLLAGPFLPSGWRRGDWASLPIPGRLYYQPPGNGERLVACTFILPFVSFSYL